MLDDSPAIALSPTTVDALDARVTVPTYDRAALSPSIVHVGVGGFHRSHLATYVHELAGAGHTDWGIVGVGVLEADGALLEGLDRQEGLYSLVSRSADGSDVEVIGSIVDVEHVHDRPDVFSDLIASAATQIVSLTITEGGYPVDDRDGAFVSEQSPPAGVFSLLAAGLDERRVRDSGPLTIMSCDNILANGDVARTAVLGACRERDATLAAWVEEHVAFPNSMVDRITPATTPADIDWLAIEFGVSDSCPVVAEPFRQWVVEDRFAGRRLPLESMDVIIADDIEPYETMKLRLLNAGHSCLAYLAALSGHVLVDEAMADGGLRQYVHTLLVREALPTLSPAPGVDLHRYIDELLERFANPGVGDQIARLCLDGSAKFPKFLLPTIRAGLALDLPIDRSTLALAGWARYLATSETPAADPLLDDVVAAATAFLDEPRTFLTLDAVFDAALASDHRFVDAFERSARALAGGVGAALAAIE